MVRMGDARVSTEDQALDWPLDALRQAILQALMESGQLTPEMLTYYGTPIDGQPETALTRTAARPCSTISR